MNTPAQCGAIKPPKTDIYSEAPHAIDAAAATLRNDPYLNLPHDDSDPAATCALVWLNALLFQQLLAANLLPANMPAPHRNTAIPVPQANASVDDTLKDWNLILSINWYPIFELARKSLTQISKSRADQALSGLSACASHMAQNQAIRRHDIAGRIFHRLLNSRKFLATNYTTIPAAAMLAGLAFGSPNGPLAGKPADDEEALATSLRIVDAACGSGTLLMAALQEVAKACRAARSMQGSPNLKPVLEQSLWGYDVVPGAQHLTNTTLSMAETSQVLSGIHIYVMPHDVDKTTGKHKARLGSLDFLKSAPNHKSTKAVQLFPQAGAASRTMMTGEADTGVHLPEVVDLFIFNPPFTRAGGPGDAAHTAWNPLFGSVLSKADSKKMTTALRKTLTSTMGSLYAGLGSAFMALIDQEIKEGKMLAVVLPLTAVTGSRWQPVREGLLDGYVIEWVIVSHDPRNRTKKTTLPGRRWVSFSESTRIAETLIVARKAAASADAARSDDHRIKDDHRVKFVNLRHNPDDPADAIALTRALLNHKQGKPVTGDTDMLCADIDYQHPTDKWGEIIRRLHRWLARPEVGAGFDVTPLWDHGDMSKAHEIVRTGMRLAEFFRRFPDDRAAEVWFVSRRWPSGPVCPHCGGGRVSEVASRRPMPYRCRECRKHFSVMSHTLMHASKLGAQTWLPAIFLIVANPKGRSSVQLAADLGVTQKTAWHLAHRIRRALAEGGLPGFDGPVEADETYIGGKARNRHAHKADPGKTAVIGVKDRRTGTVAATPVHEVTTATATAMVAATTRQGAEVYTDGSRIYDPLAAMGFNHARVIHGLGEYVRGSVSTNGVENYWSLLKRTYIGTYHYMSDDHLHRYIEEHSFRYNRRNRHVIDKMSEAAAAMEGRSLTYRELTGSRG